MNGLMVVGTASDVGKTMICTAFCRLLANDGVKVAPFKSQNMSRLSVLLPNGQEMSRSQFQQAQAAKTTPIAEMNPILLKPEGNMQSEVILLGKSLGPVRGTAYREQYFEQGLQAIRQALKTLEQRYDAIVIEGAGSTAEVNLRDRELTNMRVAELADVPAILVADISRGGAIASVVGTLQLLPPEQRRRIKGIIINKFYGEISFFQEGIDFIEEYTGVPVVGVVPVKNDHGIAEEDADREVAAAPAGVDVYDAWAEHVKAHVDWDLIRSMFA